jgi:LmbE family N-acetylglucosaminyl deacetylase
MLNTRIRNSYAKKLKSRFKKKSISYQNEDLIKNALVVAPHFDDETLGCGGIIAKKKKEGAEIKIVFMTDGTQSHSTLIENEKLNSIRSSEARRAAEQLGLSKDDVLVLNYSDSLLEKNINEASKKLLKILEDFNTAEIFIPSKYEPWIFSGDHLATTKISMNAIIELNKPVNIYEYPVWYWYSYPWVSLPLKLKKTSKNIFKISLNGLWGCGLLKHFNCYLFLRDVLDIKQKALEQHESQMNSKDGNETWDTLAGVSNGEFLNCFFNEFEVFNKSKYKIR